MPGLKPKSLFRNDRSLFVGWNGLERRGHILDTGLIGSEECLAPKEDGEEGLRRAQKNEFGDPGGGREGD